MNEEEALDLALWFADHGIPVMPVALSLDGATGITRKRPLTEHGHLSASCSEDEISKLFAAARLNEGEELAVGGTLGPGGYVGLDFDTKQGKAGGETLKRLLERWPDLALCRYRSISGALNAIVAKPPGLGPVANVVPRDWLGVDIRADAGWIVLPGSSCSWGSWKWDRGAAPLTEAWTIDAELARLLTAARPHERPADNADTEAYINARTEYTPAARAYVLEQMAGLSRAASGSRHAALLLSISRIVGLDAIDLRDALARTQEHWDALTPGEGREREPHEVLTWVLGQELAHRAPHGHGEPHGNGEQYEGARLPDSVWTLRPELAHVRLAAWSRNRSPEALLGAVLARIAADSRHTIEIPAIVGAPCGLSLYAALIGPPGTGKSSTRHLATELVPPLVLDPAADDKGLGSGEGMIEILFDLEPVDDGNGRSKLQKVQKRFNAYLGLDEGEMLDRMGARPDSILLGTIRAGWTNGTLGQANASIEKRRHLAGDLYVYGLVLGLQPVALRGLMGGAGLGTPQRFTFVPTSTNGTAPEELPPWPGAVPRAPLSPMLLGEHRYENARGFVRNPLEIPEEIRREVVAADRSQQRSGAAELDTHLGLMRLKIAGVLAVWSGRMDINPEDWYIAEEIVKVSKATRDQSVAELEQAERQRASAKSQAARAHARALRDDERLDQIDRVAARIKRLADEHPEGISRRVLLQATPKRHRESFEDALDRAVAEGWITIERVASHTGSLTYTIKPRASKR